MDLEVEVVDMVAEGFKIKQTATVLSRRESEELSGKLQIFTVPLMHLGRLSQSNLQLS